MTLWVTWKPWRRTRNSCWGSWEWTSGFTSPLAHATALPPAGSGIGSPTSPWRPGKHFTSCTSLTLSSSVTPSPSRSSESRTEMPPRDTRFYVSICTQRRPLSSRSTGTSPQRCPSTLFQAEHCAPPWWQVRFPISGQKRESVAGRTLSAVCSHRRLAILT